MPMKQVVINEIVRPSKSSPRLEYCQTSCTEISSARDQQFTHKDVVAKLKISTVITRTGKMKPTYGSIDLKPLQAAAMKTKEEK